MKRFGFIAAFTVVSLTSAAQATQYAGAILPNGTKQVSGANYTVTHPFTGRYVIKFPKNFVPYPTCIYMSVEGARPSGLVETSNTCDVTFVDSAGALTNTLFNFIAVPTSN